MMKPTRFYLLLVLFAFNLNAQYSDKQAEKDLEKTRTLLTSDLDSTLILSRKIFAKTSNISFRTKALINISLAKGLLTENDSSVYYAIKANELILQNSKNADPEIVARTFANLSTQYRNARLYSKATESTKKALKFLEQLNDPKDNWKKAGPIRELAKICLAQNKIDSAQHYINKAITLLDKGEGKNSIIVRNTYAILNNDLAEIYLQDKKMILAEQKALLAINYGKGSPYEALIRKDAYINLSYAYLQKNENRRAIDTLKVLEKDVLDNEHSISLKMYNGLAEGYFRTKDFSNYNKYIKLAKQIEDKTSKSDVIAINNLFNSLRNETKISEKRNRTITIVIISLFSFIILVLSIYYFRKNQKIKKAQKELELKILNDKIEITKKERDRISQELHDDLGSNLTSISLASSILQSKNDSTIAKEVAIISRNIEKMTLKTQEIIWSLNTDNDTLSSLIAYVRLHVQEFSELSSLKFTIKENIKAHEEVYLEAFVRRKLYLSIKEIINNAVKYSEGTIIEINFDYAPKLLAVSIEDNGKGFVKELVTNGNGLLNINKNMREINGKVHIDSEIGKGTTILISVVL